MVPTEQVVDVLIINLEEADAHVVVVVVTGVADAEEVVHGTAVDTGQLRVIWRAHHGEGLATPRLSVSLSSHVNHTHLRSSGCIVKPRFNCNVWIKSGFVP